MKIWNVLVLPPVFLFTLISCAAIGPITIRAMANNNNTLCYDKGKQVLRSIKSTTRVVLYPLRNVVDAGSPMDFYIAIANHSQNSIDFFTDNLSAQCGEKRVRVFAPEEALRDQEKRTDISSDSMVGLTGADMFALSPYMARYYERRNEELQQYASQLLTSHTVPPGSIHEGIFRIAFPACKTALRITLLAGQERHEFIFQIRNGG